MAPASPQLPTTQPPSLTPVAPASPQLSTTQPPSLTPVAPAAPQLPTTQPPSLVPAAPASPTLDSDPSSAGSAGVQQLSLSWDDIHLGTSSLGSRQASGHLQAPIISAPLSSRSASPDFLHDTVLRVSPGASLANSIPLVPTSHQGTPDPTTTPTPDDHPDAVVDPAPQPGGEAAGSRESSGISHEFLERLDVLSEEIRLEREIGRRKIDILMYRGYEHRCDRRSDRFKYVQHWKCRYAAKFKCRGGFKLDVVDLEDIEADSIVSCVKDHNHEPYSIDSYGLANVSELQDFDESEPSAPEDSENSHAISQLDDGEFSFDFNLNGLGTRVQSSPIRTARTDIYVISCTPPVDVEEDATADPEPAAASADEEQYQAKTTPNPAVVASATTGDPDASTVLVDTSQFDARGYRVQAYRDPRRVSLGSDFSQPPPSSSQL